MLWMALLCSRTGVAKLSNCRAAPRCSQYTYADCQRVGGCTGVHPYKLEGLNTSFAIPSTKAMVMKGVASADMPWHVPTAMCALLKLVAWGYGMGMLLLHIS